MHRITPNWPCTLNSQKYPMYTKYLPMRSKFWSVSLHDQRFPRYRTFYDSPLTPKKEQQNCQKSKIWNFTIYTTLVEPLPRSMHGFGGANLLCTFRQDEDVVWNFFSHMVPCERKWKKKKKKWQKSKIWNFASLYTTLEETLSRIMHEFFEWICYVISEEMSFEVFSPIWSHPNGN